ncbi:hypothetical protein [Methanococcus maripaludis]|uniref:hypothetical protein n=1 Tax=Methanococcus maripaludis TaxID=39152 RepID=UPI00131A03C1|nr:hypothetical protein [Methanococcus maripaludis]
MKQNKNFANMKIINIEFNPNNVKAVGVLAITSSGISKIDIKTNIIRNSNINVFISSSPVAI